MFAFRARPARTSRQLAHLCVWHVRAHSRRRVAVHCRAIAYNLNARLALLVQIVIPARRARTRVRRDSKRVRNVRPSTRIQIPLHSLSLPHSAPATLDTQAQTAARVPRAKSASTRKHRATQCVMRVRLREMFSARQQEQAQLIKIRAVSVTLAQHLRPELWMRVIHLRVSCAQLARTKTCWALLLVLLVRKDIGRSLERIRSLQSGFRERMTFLYVYVHPELKLYQAAPLINVSRVQ